MTDHVEDPGGRARALALIAHPPMDMREDVDHASLVRRMPALGDVAVEDLAIVGPHGPIPARAYRGRPDSDRGLVWVHGGAFIGGGLDQPESHWVALSLASRGIRVLAVDYQKARQGVRHPVLSDEVLAAWIAAAGGAVLGVPTDRLHLGGASAGANLAAGVALRLAPSDPQPASAILVYPLLHGVVPEASADAAAAIARLPEAERFTPGFIRTLSVNYAGTTAGLIDPIAFPANGRLDSFPPAYVLNAEADSLLALVRSRLDVSLARALRTSG